MRTQHTVILVLQSPMDLTHNKWHHRTFQTFCAVFCYNALGPGSSCSLVGLYFNHRQSIAFGKTPARTKGGIIPPPRAWTSGKRFRWMWHCGLFHTMAENCLITVGVCYNGRTFAWNNDYLKRNSPKGSTVQQSDILAGTLWGIKGTSHTDTLWWNITDTVTAIQIPGQNLGQHTAAQQLV